MSETSQTPQCKDPNCGSLNKAASYHFEVNPRKNATPNRCFDCFFYGGNKNRKQH